MSEEIYKITFKSSAPYTDGEFDNFVLEATDFVKGFDEDINPETISVTRVTEETVRSETLETVRDFLDNADVSAMLTVKHPDHKPFDVEFAVHEDGKFI